MSESSPAKLRLPLSPAGLGSVLSPVVPTDDSPPDCQPAGVLVPLFWQEGEPHLLFTQRTELVKHHQSQISFPGGVADPGDPHLLGTALREAWEEIGLAPRDVRVLGMLAPTATVTGFYIHPYVGVIPYPYDFRLNPREVARLLTYPLAEFLPPERWRTGPYTYQGRTVSVCCWHLDDTCIWGATARLLLDLLSRLGKNPFGTTPCRD
jgi:8-oxo-dGTP pyrophosphatase MutT (NUDIX family)